ncbi:MAG: DegT/DnrJ/EryC1/StrS family aminotransferase [Chitinivibrionales bacterium]
MGNCKNRCKPEDLRSVLEAENIESRQLWKPMHIQPVFKGYRFYGNSVCDKLFESGLCLPSGTELSEAQMTRIVSIIKDIINKG